MKKTLTLLLAIILISAALCAPAYASETEETPAPTPEATAEPTPEPTPEPTAVPTATPAPTAAPTATPAPSATPGPTATPAATATPAPTATPQPTPNKLPAKITKHPGGETVNAGGEALFTAGAENYKEIIWRIVSEDTKVTYTAKDAPGYFKGLEDKHRASSDSDPPGRQGIRERFILGASASYSFGDPGRGTCGVFCLQAHKRIQGQLSSDIEMLRASPEPVRPEVIYEKSQSGDCPGDRI